MPLAAREELGESPRWPTLAVLTAASLYATLPTRFISGPSSAGVFAAVRWIVPALTIVLLARLALSVPQQRLLQSAQRRASALRLSRRIASLGVIALMTAANAASIVLLVHLLVGGSHAQARLLLSAGIHMWCMNVLVFALWFWQLNGVGPIERRLEQRRPADFLFPQQTLGEDAGATWQPNFVDYLFVSYTKATAFSPTDTLPLSPGKTADDRRVRSEPPTRHHGRRPSCQHPSVAHLPICRPSGSGRSGRSARRSR